MTLKFIGGLSITLPSLKLRSGSQYLSKSVLWKINPVPLEIPEESNIISGAIPFH